MQSFKKYISELPELEEGKGRPGLWANIHAKRKRGERPAKPGEEGYPKTLDIEESGKGYQPGWMLKKDPELAKKLKDKIDLAKKRQASYGNPAAGKSVKENKDEHDINSLQKHFGPAVAYDAASHGPAMMKRKDISGKSHTLIKQSNGKYKSVKEDVEQLDEAVDPSEIAGNPKAYGVDTVKKAYYHKKASTSDKESLARHLDRYHGHKEWRKPLVKEETELQELSKETLGSYKHKAELSIPKDDREYANRSKGIDKAEKKLKESAIKVGDTVVYNKNKTAETVGKVHKIEANDYILHHTRTNTYHRVPKKGSELAESVEQLDELSPNLLHRYVKKATGNMGMHAVDHGKYGDQQKDKKSLNKAIKRSDGIASASGRMADKANKNEEFTPAEKAAFLAAANKKASLDYWKTHAELKKNDPRVSKTPKKESVDLDESEINDLAAQYINENNITLEQLENMTEAELNELIGAAIGGAFKLGAKAAVGATRLAGRAINRMTTSGRADAAEKKASTLEKKNADRERIRAAQDRLRKAKEAASKR
jgi:hypothetical protein